MGSDTRVKGRLDFTARISVETPRLPGGLWRATREIVMVIVISRIASHFTARWFRRWNNECTFKVTTRFIIIIL